MEPDTASPTIEIGAQLARVRGQFDETKEQT